MCRHLRAWFSDRATFTNKVWEIELEDILESGWPDGGCGQRVLVEVRKPAWQALLLLSEIRPRIGPCTGCNNSWDTWPFDWSSGRYNSQLQTFAIRQRMSVSIFALAAPDLHTKLRRQFKGHLLLYIMCVIAVLGHVWLLDDGLPLNNLLKFWF